MNLTLHGVTQPIAEWAADYGIPVSVIRARINLGASVEDAITVPMVVIAPGQKLEPNAIPVLNRPRKTRTVRRPRQYAAAYAKNACRLLQFNGESRTIKEWSQITGMSITTIHKRLSRGWSIDDTLTTLASRSNSKRRMAGGRVEPAKAPSRPVL